MKLARTGGLSLVVLLIAGALIALVVNALQSKAQATAELAAVEARSRAVERAVGEEAPLPESREPAPEEADALRTAAGTRQLEVLVQDPAGAPVGDGKLVLFRGEEVLGRGKTDSSGLAQFAPGEGVGGFAVAAPGWELQVGELELSPGRRVVSLLEGAALGGTVLVDGAVPAEPVELRWSSSDRTRDIGALPKPVAAALGEAPGEPPVASTRTRADGSFAIRGLAANASGTLRWKGPYLAETAPPGSSRSQVAVPAPRTDLLLRLQAGWELHLRVVDTQGVPQAGAGVMLRPLAEDGKSSSLFNSTADSEGRLVHRLDIETFARMAIAVSSPTGGGGKGYEFPAPRRRTGAWDVGDLSLSPTRRLTVLVRDPQAAPIEGAIVTPAPAPGIPTQLQTDAEGRVLLDISEGDRELAVSAFGYAEARVSVPADASEVVATLAAACLLEFTLPGFQGDAAAFELALQGPTPLFTGGDRAGGGLKASGSGWSLDDENGVTTLVADPERSGRWRITGLTPHQALRAKLRVQGTVLCEAEIAPLAAGETRRVELELRETAKSLRLRVLSTDGSPVAQATVSVLEWGERTISRQHTADERGELALEGIYGDRCALLVRAKGLEPKFLSVRPLPADTVEVHLGAARSVEIELVRGDGSLYTAGGSVSSSMGGSFASQKAKSIGPARFRLEGLPAGVIAIQARGPLGSLRRLHDTNIPFLRLVVDGPGSIEARVRGIADGEGDTWRIAVAASGDPSAMTNESLRPGADAVTLARVGGLIHGRYEVWLERRAEDEFDGWTRAGDPKAVALDAENPGAVVELDAQR